MRSRDHGAQAATKTTTPAAPFKVGRHRLCVLIANPEPSINCFLKSFFDALVPPSTKVRCSCTSTLSGLHRHLRKGDVDLCIMILSNLIAREHQAPDPVERVVSALDAAKRRHPRTAFVVYSAYCPDIAFVRRVERAGADSFGLLPFTARSLRRDIQRALRRSCGSRVDGAGRRTSNFER